MGLIVGLTGGIGSGKSAAADCFARLGVPVVDADVIARELTGPHGAFGDAVLAADGSLDRAAMRRLAFADAAGRSRLEGILHPAIRAEADRRCQAAIAAGAPYVVLVVPLLVESGDYRRRVGRVAVVTCGNDARIERVMARSGLSRSEVEAIMAAQADDAERLAAADDVIDNSGDLAQLAAQVDRLHAEYLALARAG
jgi:dephospho-CoA kinase